MSTSANLSRRGFLYGSAALGASLGLSALPFSAALAQEIKPGGTAVIALSSEPPVISALGHTAYYTVFVSGKTNEGLLAYDFDLTPKPQLATEWKVSDDGLRYDFTLRDGVKWHDGTPFTSKDVAFSLKTIKEVHPRGRNTFANVTDVQTPDDQHVTLILSEPAPYLIRALAASETPIVPVHLYGTGEPLENPAQNAPVGTGPYVFKEWVRGSHIIYDRNPDYWDQPKPAIDRLVIRFLPDAAARVAAIESGEVHIAPGEPIPIADLSRIEQNPELGLEWNGYQYANGVRRVEFNLDRPIFQDVRVRKAFAQVIDPEVILNLTNFGYGHVLNGPIHPNLKDFYFADLPRHEINPTKAEALLDEAGHPRGSDGTRFSVHLDYVPGSEGTRRGAEYIRQALQQIGVDAQIRAQDFATYTKRVYTDRDFDFLYNGMSNLFDPTVGVQRLYWSKNFKPGVPFSNGSHYHNPEVDQLLEASAVENDHQKRRQQWRRIQEILFEDIPSIYTVTSPEHTVFNRKIAGHTPDAAGLFGNGSDIHFIA
ncbi:ABC transporter substrate-binding protein [Paracoccus aminophilus]|uniref:ABC-type dipeptide transport system, periplasmic component n=1 Tax=Paracoccus aminophilus JCM 7686 TaxID=1367847 RepID=S5Y7K8_PARAH|nr:ABC transporter substrate-binding protein [Paracoccus aminophilus]AGT07328.1 ABC-type dipeptide transport system, periplasmic component [Paracoccus aminophilus JCM 7686]